MSDYRHGALRCPACSTVLDAKMCGNAQVDICPACFGVWIDWMDGDLSNVTAHVGALPHSSVKLDEHRRGECPICQAPLSETSFGQQGATIQRCGSCAGAFVPRESLERVAGVEERQDENAPPSDPLLTRVMDALTRLIVG